MKSSWCLAVFPVVVVVTGFVLFVFGGLLGVSFLRSRADCTTLVVGTGLDAVLLAVNVSGSCLAIPWSSVRVLGTSVWLSTDASVLFSDNVLFSGTYTDRFLPERARLEVRGFRGVAGPSPPTVLMAKVLSCLNDGSPGSNALARILSCGIPESEVDALVSASFLFVRPFLRGSGSTLDCVRALRTQWVAWSDPRFASISLDRVLGAIETDLHLSGVRVITGITDPRRVERVGSSAVSCYLVSFGNGVRLSVRDRVVVFDSVRELGVARVMVRVCWSFGEQVVDWTVFLGDLVDVEIWHLRTFQRSSETCGSFHVHARSDAGVVLTLATASPHGGPCGLTYFRPGEVFLSQWFPNATSVCILGVHAAPEGNAAGVVSRRAGGVLISEAEHARVLMEATSQLPW